MQNFRNQSIDRLMKVISEIDDPELCARFFEDLCTVKEIQDMAQRLDTAVLLNKGKSYQQIAEEVGTSTATISRVNKCLEYGAGGYREVLDTSENLK